MTATCLECSAPLTHTPGKRPKQFCCLAHKRDFNNRRQMRGAQLIDLWMAHRYDRKAAVKAGVLVVMQQMALEWREEDIAARRASFGDWQSAVDRR